MKLKISKFVFLLVCVLFITTTHGMEADAGLIENKGSCKTTSGEMDTANWNVTDDNIQMKDNKIIIPSETSTNYTRMIGKTSAKVVEGSSRVVISSADLCITKLPAQQKFILAFGLKSIEAQSGEEGNIELVFVNEGGVKLSIIAYTSGGPVTVLEKRACGVSLNSRFQLTAEISKQGLLNVNINGKGVCDKQLPLSGEGRFGLLQSGLCGAEIYELTYTTYQYDRPENVNMDVDFEQGEWNTNVVTGQMSLGTERDSSMAIQTFDGNKVLCFKNAKTAWFGTKLQYSNFELTFDIPYFQKSHEYDKSGNIVLAQSGAIGLGFGEEEERPSSYTTDTDYILFDAVSAKSSLKELWEVQYSEIGLGKLAGEESDNIGYSVKLTVVDQQVLVQVKPLDGTIYTTIADVKCQDFRAGYIKIWANSPGNFAIDNFKVMNLDENPNLIDVEYKSSIMKVEDYELTEEDTELVFRPDAKEKTNSEENILMIIVGVSVALIVALLLIVVVIRFRTNRKGGQ